ncbi:MAG: hypothetical protein K2L88_00455, partial [Clostridiales bacterium]|nr:hypothetical protein [Clostridiales bacterium]
LAALTGDDWNTLDFLHFVMYLGDCFILRDDGRYDFSHKSIRQGILKSTDAKRIHNEIAGHFWSIHADDIAQSEMLYHFISADNKRMFYYYVISMAYDVVNSVEKDKAAAVMNDAALGTLGMRIMSAIEFTSDGGKWIAQAIETAPCENQSPTFGFILSMTGVIITEMRLRAHTSSLPAVTKALLNYAARAQECGFDVDALIPLLRSYYGQACVLNGNMGEYKDIATDNYAEAQAAYRADPNDHTLMDYLSAIYPKIFSSHDSDDISANMEELFDEVSELAEITGDRYDEEPNDLTAHNNFFMLLVCAVWNYFNDGSDLLLNNVKEALDCILPYIQQYSDVELVPMLDMMLMIADMASDTYITNLQNGLYDPISDEKYDEDEEYDDGDSEHDKLVQGFLEQMIDCDDDEQKMRIMMEMVQSIEAARTDDEEDEEYDDEDDEEYEDEEEDENEDEDEESSIEDTCRNLSEAAERLYNAVMAIFLRMNAQNHTGYEAHACTSAIRLSSMRFAEGAMESAARCLDIAEDVLDEMDSAGKLTQAARDTAYKIKSMRLKIRINSGDTDYADMLMRAREVLRDTENIPSNSAVHNETLAEALNTLVGIYVHKLLADSSSGKLDLKEVTEAESLCDRLETLLSQLLGFNVSAQEELTATRDLLASLKS